MPSFFITVVQLFFAIFMYAMGTLFFGLALIPALALVFRAWSLSLGWPGLGRLFILGLSLSAGYFLFGFTLILLVGLFRTVLRIRLKEGLHPMYSLEALKWGFISSLYLMIHYTFIDFILLTPFANLLFRLLGARLGKNGQFNSKFVFDASLLEIGDHAVIGGGAIINGHIVERGMLRLKKVKIGKNVTIGSHATIMPGCEIGDGATIGASAVLMRNAKVGEKEIWFGLPAENIRQRHHSLEKSNPEKEDHPDAQGSP